jgi:hypothetical protein
LTWSVDMKRGAVGSTLKFRVGKTMLIKFKVRSLLRADVGGHSNLCSLDEVVMVYILFMDAFQGCISRVQGQGQK